MCVLVLTYVALCLSVADVLESVLVVLLGVLVVIVLWTVLVFLAELCVDKTDENVDVFCGNVFVAVGEEVCVTVEDVNQKRVGTGVHKLQGALQALLHLCGGFFFVPVRGEFDHTFFLLSSESDLWKRCEQRYTMRHWSCFFRSFDE